MHEAHQQGGAAVSHIILYPFANESLTAPNIEMGGMVQGWIKGVWGGGSQRYDGGDRGWVVDRYRCRFTASGLYVDKERCIPDSFFNLYIY